MAIAAGLAGALILASSVIEHRFGSAGAVDRVLEGTFNLAVPLLAFAGRRGCDRSEKPHGRDLAARSPWR